MGFNEELLGLFETEMGDMAQLTQLSGDLRNKVVTIYGDNGTGKTTQVSRLSKLGYSVVFISLEKGLNAISGVMNIGVKTYADITKVVKKLTSKKFTQMLDKEPIIIVWDGIENLKTLAENYVCSQAGVDKVKEGNSGYGLWEEYRKALSDVIVPILDERYTTIFICHPEIITETVNKKKVPVGVDLGCEKRLKKILKDNSDFILYLENNEDEDGEELNSIAYSRPSNGIKARSRFSHFPPCFEFTAENLIEGLSQAVEKQAKEEDVKVVDAQTQLMVYGKENEESFEEILEDVKNILANVEQDTREEEMVFDLLDKTFGMGVSLSDLTQKNKEALMVFRDEITDILAL